MRHSRLPSLLLAMSVGIGCGGGPPTGPSSGPGGIPAGTTLQIHTRVAALRVGELEDVTVNLSGGVSMSGPAMLSSTDPSVFVVENNSRLRAVGPGRARLVGAYQTLTAEVPQMVVAIGPTPNPAASAAFPQVWINEFRTSGPGGPRDEFIELKNVSGTAVDVTGWSIAIITATGHRESFGVILAGESEVGAGCHYLLTGASGPNAYSSGTIATGDFRWSSSFFEDSVSFALLDPLGRIVDQVGLSANQQYGEGPSLAPLAGRSYERIAETNDNAADFRASAADSPRNRGSNCG